MLGVVLLGCNCKDACVCFLQKRLLNCLVYKDLNNTG